MRGQFLKGVAVGAVASTVVLMAASAFAGTGVGGVFNLGRTNHVDATTSLAGSTSGSMLHVTNSGAGAGIAIKVPAGKPPLTVSSSTLVRHLDADELDGLTSNAFVRNGDAAGGALVGAYPSPNLAAPEAFHVIGDVGELQFFNGWASFGDGAESAGYFVDPFGVVHLRGAVQCTPGGGQTCAPGFGESVFQFPEEIAPALNQEFAVDSNLAFGEVVVKGNGVVAVQVGATTAYVSLDGITFRAGN